MALTSPRLREVSESTKGFSDRGIDADRGLPDVGALVKRIAASGDALSRNNLRCSQFSYRGWSALKHKYQKRASEDPQVRKCTARQRG